MTVAAVLVVQDIASYTGQRNNMRELAKVVNHIIESIILGDHNDFPDRIDSTGTPWGVGWVSHDNDITFSKPPVIPVYRTILSKAEYRQLFIANSNKNKYKRMKQSTDDDVDIMWEIIQAGSVDLTEQYIIDGMGALIPTILTQQQHDDIMQGILE